MWANLRTQSEITVCAITCCLFVLNSRHIADVVCRGVDARVWLLDWVGVGVFAFVRLMSALVFLVHACVPFVC